MNPILKLSASALVFAAVAALPACQNTNLKVPSTASEVAAGSGTTAYRAAEPGHIYVYDRTWNKIRYSGAIHTGQLLVVDPRNDRIMIDNQPVVEQVPLDANAQFEIYLDHHLVESRPPVIERRTVIEREIHD